MINLILILSAIGIAMGIINMFSNDDDDDDILDDYTNL